MIEFLRRAWWTLVAMVGLFVLMFIFGPACVQKWEINAIYSVLQWMGV